MDCPRWYVAVPFLPVCGVASAHFLGSRPVPLRLPLRRPPDPAEKPPASPSSLIRRLRPVRALHRILSVGVRVMDEVNRYGSIVTSRCVRSLDCVSVCPQHALSLGSPPRRHQVTSRSARDQLLFLSLAEEATATGAGLTTFFAARCLRPDPHAHGRRTLHLHRRRGRRLPAPAERAQRPLPRRSTQTRRRSPPGGMPRRSSWLVHPACSGCDGTGPPPVRRGDHASRAVIAPPRSTAGNTLPASTRPWPGAPRHLPPAGPARTAASP